MNVIQQLLTEHIDIWTAAETEKKSGRGRSSGNAASVYGIKKLRELILELAMRGKLVPQDTNDEPASALMERIHAEKTKLIAEKKIKKENLQPDITDEEKPFDLPLGWEWARFGQVVEVLDSLRKPVTQQDREPGPYPYYGASGVVDYVSNYIFDEPLVLVGEDGAKWGCGDSTAFVIAGKTWVNNHAHVVRPYRSAIIDEFLVCSLNAMDLQRFITGMTVPKLNQARLVSIVLPIPSISEQHRIVAKVDEMMALCDQLESQHSNAAEAHEKLVSHLLGTLTQSQNAADFSANWQRIAAHFDTLFTTEASIDAFKQTLLQLAVMGKLVQQDPNDEPASALLKRIQAEKAKLISEGKIKKDKPLAAIADDEKPFELPQGWEWVRLKDIVYLLGDGLHGTPTYTPNTDCYFVNGNNLDNGQIIIKPETKTVSLDELKKHRKNLNERTVLVSINGTIGNVAFYNNENIILGKSACYFNLANFIYKYFVKLLIESPYFIGYAFNSVSGTTIMNLSLFSMNNFPLSIPPLAEQHRIVAKVDELMALCDKLKSRLNDASRLQQKIADVLVEQAVA